MSSPFCITVTDLSRQLGKAHQRVLAKYLRHADVTNVLCVQSPLSGAPRLIPIGKGLDYETVDAALADFEATASQTFLVDATVPIDEVANALKPKNDSLGNSYGKGEVVESERVRELTKQLKEAEARIAELIHLEDLKKALDEHEADLNSREESLVRMEDELMQRMHLYLERVAEVEQREDNLAAREAFYGNKCNIA